MGWSLFPNRNIRVHEPSRIVVQLGLLSVNDASTPDTQAVFLKSSLAKQCYELIERVNLSGKLIDILHQVPVLTQQLHCLLLSASSLHSPA